MSIENLIGQQEETMAKRLLLLALIVIVAVGCKEGEPVEVPLATATPAVSVTPTLALTNGGQYLKEKEIFSIGVESYTYENLYWDSYAQPGVYGSGLLGTVLCGDHYGLYILGTSTTDPCAVSVVYFFIEGEQIKAYPNLQTNATILKELK